MVDDLYLQAVAAEMGRRREDAARARLAASIAQERRWRTWLRAALRRRRAAERERVEPVCGALARLDDAR